MTHFSLIRQLILLLHKFDFFQIRSEKVFLSFLLWFYRIYIFRSRVFLSDSVGPGSKLIGTIFSLLMTEFYVIEYTKYLYSVIDPSLGQ